MSESPERKDGSDYIWCIQGYFYILSTARLPYPDCTRGWWIWRAKRSNSKYAGRSQSEPDKRKRTRSKNRSMYLRRQREKLCILSQSSVKSDPKTDDNSRHNEHCKDNQLFSDETRNFFGYQYSFYSHRRITGLQETFDSTAGTVLSSTQERGTKEQW